MRKLLLVAFFAKLASRLEGRWWRIGLLISFVNLAVWTVVGFAWWKIIALW